MEYICTPLVIVYIRSVQKSLSHEYVLTLWQFPVMSVALGYTEVRHSQVAGMVKTASRVQIAFGTTDDYYVLTIYS